MDTIRTCRDCTNPVEGRRRLCDEHRGRKKVTVSDQVDVDVDDAGEPPVQLGVYRAVRDSLAAMPGAVSSPLAAIALALANAIDMAVADPALTTQLSREFRQTWAALLGLPPPAEDERDPLDALAAGGPT